ncbi:MAG TPA: 3'(2'),5'-bisphosphate nucleotidase CysQ [Gammaproteobacteria bacterium]|nr:3'(2'),5'-bisphosphate nucleotidase CysQ [Gammaproteobacteria bacterium]
MNDLTIQTLLSLSEKAAHCVLAIYQKPSFDVRCKEDKSPLTEADSASHAIICAGLQQHFPAIPVISEESTEFHSYAVRQQWETFFLVDPLDGTKEFIHRNHEFTINIALIHQNQPVMGVIHAPALGVIYYAEKNKGAFKIIQNKTMKLSPTQSEKNNTVTVAVSRSHFCHETETFLQDLRDQGKKVVTISAGSALKFGLVAEGLADIYPRLTPTMEWDTAAGQILVNEVGKKMTLIESGEVLRYNKKELKNGGFVVE